MVEMLPAQIQNAMDGHGKLMCEMRGMMFAIKAEVSDPKAKTFAFSAQKTMYGGKHIAKGDTIFVFASETGVSGSGAEGYNETPPGLIASGVVTSADAIAKKRGIARQTPRVSITIRRTALAKRRLGRRELNLFPTGTTVAPRPSSILNSIVRRRTRLSASRIKPRRYSADSFNEGISTRTRYGLTSAGI
jgi:hypothetical protein